MQERSRKQKFLDFTGTIRFKILVILLAFLMVYVVTFSFFLLHTVRTAREKILSSYEDMLDLYVDQTEQSLENADGWLRNVAGNFNLNMMAIQDVETDDYVLSKYSTHYEIRRNFPTYTILDAVYLYDSRNDSFLVVPDDVDHFETLVRRFWDEEGETAEGWRLIGEEGNYTLFRQYVVNASVHLMAFVKLDKVAEELQTLAAGNNLSWEICTKEGTLLFGDETGASDRGGHTLEKAFRNVGLEFRMAADNVELWKMNLSSILVFLGTVLLLFIAGWFGVFYGVRKRLLAPLELLIGGMQEFAGGKEEVTLSPNGKIEREMAFAIDTFNGMVSQIRRNRFLIYEEKLANQKLVIQNLFSQINPHFFSNTLNMIYNLIATGRDEIAKKGLLLLSSYYRFMCGLDRDRIPLAKEMAFLGDYLEIMKLRFPNKLDARIFLDEELSELKIPPMLLQPLAENSMKYGFVNRSKPFHLSLSARVSGEDAVLSAVDSGKGFPEAYRGTFGAGHALAVPESPEEDNQVGLRNIYQRLQMYYGEDADLEIDWDGTWTVVRIVIRNWKQYV
ncbi:MAG: histidine kinase [Eubacteriales bacterium]|nr:histidine kinase [Eubacteriales bacterium]